MNSPKDESGLAMHSEVFRKTMDKINNRLFTKALEIRRFEKYLPQLTYRKRAKVHRCTKQMLSFAVKTARREVEKIVMEVNDKLEVADFLMFREKSQIKFEQDFDQGDEFLDQLENKLRELIKEVENGRRYIIQ